MGWLFGWYDRSTMAEHLLKGEETESTKLTKIANAFTGNNLWVVWERTNKKQNETYRFIVLYLLRRQGKAEDGPNWGYKDVDESMGPCEVNCPLALLKLAPLTPTTAKYEYAVRWRKDVEEYWNHRHAAAEYVKTMKNGQRFTAHGREYIFRGLYRRDYVLAYRAEGNGPLSLRGPFKIPKSAIVIDTAKETVPV